MSFLYKISLFLFVLLIAFGNTDLQAQKKKKNKKKNKAAKALTSGQDNKSFEALFIDANQAIVLEEYDKAISILEKCLDVQPANAAVNFELAKLHFEQNELEKAGKYAERARGLEAGNKWYAYLYGDILAKQHLYGEAADVFDKLVKEHPNNPDMYFDLAFMYKASQQYEKAIEVYDELERKIGIDESTSLEKQRLYIRLNKIDEGANEIQKLIDVYPREVKYYRLLADLYEGNSRSEKALEVYQKLDEVSPGNPYTQLAILNSYKDNNEEEKYWEGVKTLFSNPELGVQQKLEVMVRDFNYGQMMSEEEKNRAHELGDILVETHPEDPSALAVKGDLFAQQEKLDRAIEYYKKAVALDGNNLMVWEQVFILEMEMKRYDDMVEDADKAIELFPNNAAPYYYKGLAQSLNKENDSAIKSLKRATLIGDESKIFMAQIHSQLAECYNAVKKYEMSDLSFDQALEIDPDNPYFLNNYSYYLSNREERLDEAAKMSKRSNEIMPNISSFQDTYAWILFKQEKFKDAASWLEKSMANGGDTRPVILDHYGDVLFKLGKKDEALEFWKKSKTLGMEGKEIDRKIEERKIN